MIIKIVDKITTSLINDHGFSMFNERMLMEYPVCQINNGQPVIPHTWRKVTKYNGKSEFSNTFCRKANVRIGQNLQAVFDCIEIN